MPVCHKILATCRQLNFAWFIGKRPIKNDNPTDSSYKNGVGSVKNFVNNFFDLDRRSIKKLDLDEFMRIESLDDTADNFCLKTLLTDSDYGIERVGKCFKVLSLI